MKGKSVGTNVFGSGILGPMFLLLKQQRRRSREGHQAGRDRLPGLRGRHPHRAASTSACSTSRSPPAPRPRAACASCSRWPTSRRTSCTSWRCAGRTSSTRTPSSSRLRARSHRRHGKALANRDETLKVVYEVTKAPVAVLDTYLLKPNDFAREPGAAPNFAGIQAMLDIYAETGMMAKKLDAQIVQAPHDRRTDAVTVLVAPSRDRAAVTRPAMIAIEAVSKTFETKRGRPHLALTDISLARGRRRVRLRPRPVGLRQVDPALHRRRLRGALDRVGDGRRQAGDRPGPRSRAGVPGVRAVSLEDGARQRHVRAQATGRGEGARRRRARASCSPWCTSPATRTSIPRSSPAA